MRNGQGIHAAEGERCCLLNGSCFTAFSENSPSCQSKKKKTTEGVWLIDGGFKPVHPALQTRERISLPNAAKLPLTHKLSHKATLHWQFDDKPQWKWQFYLVCRACHGFVLRLRIPGEKFSFFPAPGVARAIIKFGGGGLWCYSPLANRTPYVQKGGHRMGCSVGDRI